VNSATFGFIPPVPVIAPALPLAVPVTTGAAVAGVGLAASLPIVAAVGIGLAGGFLLGAALAQLWGRIAGPRRSTPVALAERTTREVLFTSQKTLSFSINYLVVSNVTRCSDGRVFTYVSGPGVGVAHTRQAFGLRIVGGNDSYVRPCGQPAGGFVYSGATYQLFDGTNWLAPVGVWGGSFEDLSTSGYNRTWQTWIESLTVNGVPYTPPAIPQDWSGAALLGPALVPQAEEIPLAPVLPSPALAAVPEVEGNNVTPLTPATAAIAVGSGVGPSAALVPLTPPLPGVQQINNSGALVPAALPKLAPTAEEAHFPVPGGAAVGSIATAPQATLAGIAAEVGRIESKLNRLLNPSVSGDASDLLQLLWQGLQGLINSLVDNRPGGQYELSSPCVLDSNDERVVYTAEFPETEDNTAAVLARLDALAALLQIHKDLKQPICHQTPAVGQPVQVQFVQIE